MKCPACQTALKEDAKFCFKCGQRIPRCPSCGEPVLTRAKFCGKDGTRLPQEILDLLPGAPEQTQQTPWEQEKPAAPAVDIPIVPVLEKTAEPAEQRYEVPQPVHSCARCGGPAPEGRKFCADCVAKMRQNNAAAQQRQPQQAPQKFCAKCGNPVADGQNLCASCRRSIAQDRASREEQQKSGSSRNPLLILVVILTIVILLLAGIALCVAFTGANPFAASGTESEETVSPADVSNAGSSWFVTNEDEELSHMATEPPVVETEPPATEAPTEPPTEAPTEPEVDEDSRVLYFVNNCDSMYLSYSDIEGFDEEMCRRARNGIYAKSGRKFQDSALQEYFEQYDWYEPRVDPSAFTAGMLNEYQNANLNLIMNYEREHGYR